MRKHLNWILGLALVLGLGACNLPTSSASDNISIEAQAGTLAAQTVEASINQRPSKTPEPQNTPTKTLPTMTPAPTGSPTPTENASPPTAPSLQKYNFFCSWNGSNTEMEITIQWTDKSDNELGYLIYRNGEEIANLIPNTVVYTDTFAVSTGQAVNYAIGAYNNSGISGQFTLSATCE